MILKAITRGNGASYARYLQHSKNDTVRVLDIRGTSQPDDLEASLFEMCLGSQLTRSDKALLEIVIRPADGESKRSDEEWKTYLDTIEKHIPEFAGQARAAVLQQYKEEWHVHALWSRYDPENERMIPTSHIAAKLNKARKEIEQEYGHTPIPTWQEKKRNQRMDQFKENFVDIAEPEPPKPPEPDPAEEKRKELERLLKEEKERQAQREKDRGMTM